MMKWIRNKFLTMLGGMKLYPWPMWFIYCPTSFLVKGTDTRLAMKYIRPGDIVLRGYRFYVDGFFIPGEYSHTGIYVGGGQLIHAVTEGVQRIDIIDFLRCDKYIVLRPKSGQKEAIQRLERLIGSSYDFDFVADNAAYYCHELGAAAYPGLQIDKVWPTLFGIRIKSAGKKYLADSFLKSPDFVRVVSYNGRKTRKDVR